MRLFYIRFSRRKLRAFVVPFFLMYVFTKPPPRFSPGGGCVGVVILMRLGLAGGFDLWLVFFPRTLCGIAFISPTLFLAAEQAAAKGGKEAAQKSPAKAGTVAAVKEL